MSKEVNKTSKNSTEVLYRYKHKKPLKVRTILQHCYFIILQLLSDVLQK